METLTIPCDRKSITEKVKERTLISPFENGAEQMRAKWSSPLREWTLHFLKLKTVGEQLKDFWIARKGSAESFYWTSPIDNVQYTVRFKDDDLTREAIFHDVAFECSLTLVETR